VFVGMGSETGITASYYTLTNYIRPEDLRKYNAFVFIVCTAAAAGNLYISPKLWFINKTLNWPILISLIANLVSVIAFMVFWYSNPQVRVPVNNKITDIIEEEKMSILADEFGSQHRRISPDPMVHLSTTEGVSHPTESLKVPTMPTLQNRKPISVDGGRLEASPNQSIIATNASFSKRTTQIIKSKSFPKLFKRFLTKFTTKFVALMIFNMTTSSAYLCAISFQTTF
jgi:RsiW-degrading membrane proteinase PrsW (M82 family)